MPGVEVLHVVDCSMGFGPEAATFGAPHHMSSSHLWFELRLCGRSHNPASASCSRPVSASVNRSVVRHEELILRATLMPWRTRASAPASCPSRVHSEVRSTIPQRVSDYWAPYQWLVQDVPVSWPFLFSWLTFFCIPPTPPPVPGTNPPGSLEFWSQALFSGEHNPSPLPCFLLIVTPLIVFVTRIPPCLEGEGRGREQRGI